MDRDSLRGEIVEIFNDVMDLEEETISDATTAEEVEEWDSLSHVRLIVAVERAYGIKFSNAEIEGMERFGDLLDLVIAKKAA